MFFTSSPFDDSWNCLLCYALSLLIWSIEWSVILLLLMDIGIVYFAMPYFFAFVVSIIRLSTKLLGLYEYLDVLCMDLDSSSSLHNFARDVECLVLLLFFIMIFWLFVLSLNLIVWSLDAILFWILLHGYLIENRYCFLVLLLCAPLLLWRFFCIDPENWWWYNFFFCIVVLHSSFLLMSLPATFNDIIACVLEPTSLFDVYWCFIASCVEYFLLKIFRILLYGYPMENCYLLIWYWYYIFSTYCLFYVVFSSSPCNEWMFSAQ